MYRDKRGKLLDFALKSGYITQEEYNELDGVYETISGGLVKMMDDAENWCGPAGLVKEDEETYGGMKSVGVWE